MLLKEHGQSILSPVSQYGFDISTVKHLLFEKKELDSIFEETDLPYRLFENNDLIELKGYFSKRDFENLEKLLLIRISNHNTGLLVLAESPFLKHSKDSLGVSAAAIAQGFFTLISQCRDIPFQKLPPKFLEDLAAEKPRPQYTIALPPLLEHVKSYCPNALDVKITRDFLRIISNMIYYYGKVGTDYENYISLHFDNNPDWDLELLKKQMVDIADELIYPPSLPIDIQVNEALSSI